MQNGTLKSNPTEKKIFFSVNFVYFGYVFDNNIGIYNCNMLGTNIIK